MRYVAIDLGDKRTGLAVGDDETGIATALRVVETPLDRPDALIAAILEIVRTHSASGVVLGLPLNADGSQGPQSRRVREFGAQLERALPGTPVRLFDERHSSEEADRAMARSGLTRAGKKKRRDALAAAAILRDFLDSLTNPSAQASPAPDAPEFD